MGQIQKHCEKILLHSCCAVCSAHPLQKLEKMDFSTVVYFFNPNIHPQAEYERRLDELEGYCKKKGVEYIVEDYETAPWYEHIKGLENEPERGARCDKCFEFRLEKTAQKALELGINNFTTTLTVSPHKNSLRIIEIGNKIAQKYGINFIKENFKKENGFLKTMELAKENGFYRQQYCGCILHEHST